MRILRPVTPDDLRERPELAAYAVLYACLDIARATLLANIDDVHNPHACKACLADAVLLHVDALMRALEHFLDVMHRDTDHDDNDF